MLIFDYDTPGRHNTHGPRVNDGACQIKQRLLRKNTLNLPSVSELQVVRHYTRLSQKNFSIDSNFYPLGSCTMKYNPKAAHALAGLDGFLNHHPHAHEAQSQGILSCCYELQEWLATLTGMSAVSLTPMAGSQGELAGVMMIRAYHDARGDFERKEFLVPAAAHGTNPASAVMAGFRVKELPINDQGDMDLEALEAALGPQTAGIMLTNPSTCGVFETQISTIAKMVHKAGGLLYYDGANLNAILAKVKPGEMGFDVMHMNLHKTFATPHGGGGPGSGPVAVNDRLKPFLPLPYVIKDKDHYRWATRKDVPQSIGRLSAFMGNMGINLRAHIYIRLLGLDGLRRVSDFAVLNANYLLARFVELGLQLAYPDRRASHEFIITFAREAKTMKLSAMDFAKRLLDFGIHAPTTYFPLLVPECWLIEPTETENKQTLDEFVDAVRVILEEGQMSVEQLKKAPFSCAVERLDEVKAARDLDLSYVPEPIS